MSASTAVLTREQARQITGEREPLVPVEYEQAVKNLEACSTLDEAKYWSDKSDALAAWAKIFRNDKAGREARKLKIHAYRRMGVLAKELRPGKPGAIPGLPSGSGTPKGPVSLLVETGLPVHSANAAMAIAKLSKRELDKALNAERPPAPSSLLTKFANPNATESWRLFAGVFGGNCPLGFRSWCRGKEAKTLARGLAADEVIRARAAIREIQEWLDEFDQYLPKEKR